MHSTRRTEIVKWKLKSTTIHRSCFRLALFVQFQLNFDCLAAWFGELEPNWCRRKHAIFFHTQCFIISCFVDVYRGQGCLYPNSCDTIHSLSVFDSMVCTTSEPVFSKCSCTARAYHFPYKKNGENVVALHSIFGYSTVYLQYVYIPTASNQN